MYIYFRACEKQATISNVTRFNNIDKTTLLKKCWLSLQASVLDNDTVIIINDTLSVDTLEWLKRTSNTNNIIVISVEHGNVSGQHYHTITFVEALEKYTTAYPEEIHYAVEDDYIHVPNALHIMRNTLQSWNGFAVSYDYPDRYAQPIDCKVLLGPDRHWRTINSCTMTVAALGKVWISVIDMLKMAAPTSNDKVFEQIFTLIPCISPLPGLSSHMTEYHITPFINSIEILKSYDTTNI